MDLLSVSGWLVGLAGLVVGVWGLLSARKTKKLVLSHRSIDVAAALPEGRRRPRYAFSDGTIADEAYFTTVSVENQGNTTVSNEDLRAPMRLQLESPRPPRVLEYAAFTSARDEDVDIEQDGDQPVWIIRWKHLDPGQHITLDVYTDVFVNAVTSDGHFSYETKLALATGERFWGAARMYAMLVAGLIAFDLALLIYRGWTTDGWIEITAEQWTELATKSGFYLGFYILLMSALWVVNRYWRPGPRFISSF